MSWLVMILAVLVGAKDAPVHEKLVVFLSPGEDGLEKSFRESGVPDLRALAERLGLSFEVVDIHDRGAPPDLVSTPTIVYMNHRGRAVYQGRWTALDRLESYLQTARRVSPRSALLAREDVCVWRDEGVQVAGKIKVTAISGTAPSDLAPDAFTREATRGVAEGFEKLRWKATSELARGDRTYYLDVYPYRSEDDDLFLSLAIFSQFNCHVPVARTQSPVTGRWSERAKVYGAAGRELERLLFVALRSPEWGEGWRAVGPGVSRRSWDDLGLGLPAKPEDTVGVQFLDGPLPERWVVVAAENDTPPPVLFHFSPPLDYYTGTVKTLRGELTLAGGARLVGAQGWMEVDVSSLSMGEPDLDDSLLGSDTFDVKQFPVSRLTARSFESEDRALEYGEVRSAVLTAEFRIKKMTAPVTVRLQLQPVVDERGRRRLRVDGAFSVRLEGPFGLLGPDGPSPAKDTVVVRVDFLMAPRPAK